MEKISIECGEVAPTNGILKVWWRREGGLLNKELKANKPIWEILNSHQTFLLCSVGETIEIDEKVLVDNFTEVE
jgi:hypothetical protein